MQSLIEKYADFQLANEKRLNQKMQKQLLASIIIRTYNEEKNIENCLNKVFSQNYRDFEVIIIDSESKDNTLRIASKFPIKIIKIKKKDFSFGKSLNIGAESAKGKYLVFISAHVIPVDNNWLKNLIKNLNDKNIAGVYGKQIPAKNCNPLTKRQMFAHWKNTKKVQTKDPFFSSANSAIKKDIWEKIRFDEILPGSEDHDWAKKVQKQGYSILYEPDAIVIHSHNETLRQIFNRNYREVYANFLIYNKKLFFRYLTDSFYNFYKDVAYILKNKETFFWVLKSFINSLILIFSSTIAFLRALNIDKNKIKK